MFSITDRRKLMQVLLGNAKRLKFCESFAKKRLGNDGNTTSNEIGPVLVTADGEDPRPDAKRVGGILVISAWIDNDHPYWKNSAIQPLELFCVFKLPEGANAFESSTGRNTVYEEFGGWINIAIQPYFLP